MREDFHGKLEWSESKTLFSGWYNFDVRERNRILDCGCIMFVVDLMSTVLEALSAVQSSDV